jgi:hypothetical protein
MVMGVLVYLTLALFFERLGYFDREGEIEEESKSMEKI